MVEGMKGKSMRRLEETNCLLVSMQHMHQTWPKGIEILPTPEGPIREDNVM